MEDKVTTQIEMERMYAKNQLIHRIKKEFLDAGALEGLAEKGIDGAFGLDLLVQMYLHKRTTVEVLVGILWRHFLHHENPFQACADALYEAVEKDLADYQMNQFVVKWMISPEVQKEIDQYQYPLPMIVPPNEIKDNKTTGYMTIKGSVILKNNHHEDDVCLEHLNKMNSIKLCINEHTLSMVRNEWKNLDQPKDGEEVKEYLKRVKAFEKYDKTSRDILDGLFMMGNEFYLTHKYDKRGRTYCQGYHVNTMGSPWNKALIEFADKELVE